MKKTIRLIGIIALAALIGLSFAACGGGDDNGGGGGGGGGRLSGKYVRDAGAAFSFEGSTATFWQSTQWVYKCSYSVSGDNLTLGSIHTFNKNHPSYSQSLEEGFRVLHEVVFTNWKIIDSNTIQSADGDKFRK